jgi:ribonuclease E
MIRFSVIVSVVVAAIGLLIVGAVAGELMLVYVSIALAALALLLLIVGVAVWRDNVFAHSARRDDREPVPVGAGGPAERAAGAGAGAPADWHQWSAPAPGYGSHGGDTREFGAPGGALPDRESAERYRHPGEARAPEQVLRPAEPPGRSREPGRRDRPRREPGGAERPAREPAAAEWAERQAMPAERPGWDQAAGERLPRESVPAERSGREVAAEATERTGREPAGDLGRREAPSSRRSDRADRYPTVQVPERFEPADDPTRLAHRLDSLSDLGRTDDISAGSQAGSAVWSRTPSGPDAWLRDEPTSADTAGPELPTRTSPAGAAAGRETGQPAPAAAAPAQSTQAAAAPVAPVSAEPPAAPVSTEPPAPPSAAMPATLVLEPGDAVGTEAAAEPGGKDASVAAAPVPAGPADAGTAAADGAADTAPGLGPEDQVSVVPGIARYHKADCILIRFLGEDDLEVLTRREAEATGCAPCRACRPDRPSESG